MCVSSVWNTKVSVGSGTAAGDCGRGQEPTLTLPFLTENAPGPPPSRTTEAEGMLYAIRLSGWLSLTMPANKVLQESIARLLTRPSAKTSSTPTKMKIAFSIQPVSATIAA